MSEVEVDELLDVPEFEPGWPDPLPLALLIGRVTVTQHSNQDPASDDDVVVWRMHIGTAEEHPRMAFIGELMVRSPYALGAATVILPFVLRDEEAEIADDYVDGLLKQYAGWVSGIMYDHAATQLRAANAGTGLPLNIPFGTPQVTVD